MLRQRAATRARLPSPDWTAVTADFDAGLAIFEQLETLPYLARALRDYGLALQAAGRVKEGAEKLRRAVELFESLQIRPEGALPSIGST